jgi:hypothetical protein
MEAGFDAHKRQDVRLYYGARNLGRMAYQVHAEAVSRIFVMNTVDHMEQDPKLHLNS